MHLPLLLLLLCLGRFRRTSGLRDPSFASDELELEYRLRVLLPLFPWFLSGESEE
jgi:hypothetical protein